MKPHKLSPKQKLEADQALAKFDSLPDAAFVRVHTVSQIYGGVTHACIYNWVKSGNIPAPKRLGPNVSAWNVGELRKALASATAA